MMKIALISDLHIGHHGTGLWHNRVMFDRAAEILTQTVRRLNQIAPDLVILLGDITHSGTPESLTYSLEMLRALECSWLILPGNHDRPALRNQSFDRIFRKHVPALFQDLQGLPALFIRDSHSDIDDPNPEIGPERMGEIIAELEEHKPAGLLIFSHIPLNAQQEYAHRFDFKYVPHYRDASLLLQKIDPLVPGRIVCFNGHEHWHRIVETPKHVFCTVASLIEYPMEIKLISIEGHRIRIDTPDTACQEIARASLESADWTKGQPRDRCFSTHL